MTREDFRIVPNYYTTNALTYILYQDKVIGFAETYNDNYYEEIELGTWKSRKKKRLPVDVTIECEKIINKYIKTYYDY